MGEPLLHGGGTKPSKFDAAAHALLTPALLAFSFGPCPIAKHDHAALASSII